MSAAPVDAEEAEGDNASLDGVVAPEELLSAVDSELRPLLPALRACRTGRVNALTGWRSIGFVSLLPFHLHVRWPDAVPWIGLNASFAVIPFTAADFSMASQPLHRVKDVRLARRAAKAQRSTEKRDLPKDFVSSDWEIGADRDRAHFDELLLASSAFAWIQKVKSNGETRGVPRPELGRHAKRDAPCSLVFVPGAREPSARAIDKLASADVLIVDLQRLRGRRSLRTVNAVVSARDPKSPTLIVAASPSDLFVAGFVEPPAADSVHFVGPAPQVDSLDVIPIAQDRLAAEMRFEASLPEAGRSHEVDRVVALAKNAWWATRQAIDADASSWELRHFERGLELLTREDPLSAGLFTACRDLIQTAASDASTRTERLAAGVQSVIRSRSPGPTLVLARNTRDGAALRRGIGDALDLHENDVEALDVSIRTIRSPRPERTPGTAVIVGYSGLSALDALLASGARHSAAVFDPIETRVAWYHAQRLADYLDHVSAGAAAASLRRIGESLAPHVTGSLAAQDLRFDDSFPGSGLGTQGAHESPASDEAIVSLADGTHLRVPIGTRFEVLGRHGRGSRVKVVSSLVPGDQVVLLDEHAHALFSERRMAALDGGVLKKESGARTDWLVLVRAVADAKGLSGAKIARDLAARGHPVTTAAVNRWLADKPEDAHVPRRPDRFLALASVMGIQLPEDTLSRYHRDIHAWRVRHRKAGREVAQAIRLAYAGRLGPTSLARIEREWGVAVRGLVDAAQVGIVDEVILPQESAA